MGSIGMHGVWPDRGGLGGIQPGWGGGVGGYIFGSNQGGYHSKQCLRGKEPKCKKYQKGRFLGDRENVLLWALIFPFLAAL